MVFRDPGESQFYPQPLTPSFTSAGTSHAALAPIPDARRDTLQLTKVDLTPPSTPHFPTDKTLGVSSQGIGDIFGAVTKAADVSYKDLISKEAYEKIDPVRTEYTKSLEDQIAYGLPMEKKPEGGDAVAIDRGINRVQDVKDALEGGRKRPSDYLADLDTIARQLREKYPGYREFIDNKISEITGGTPANKLLAARIQEYNDIQRALGAKQDEFEKFLFQNKQYLPPMDSDVWKKGPDALKAYVLNQAGAEHRQKELREEARFQKDAQGGVYSRAVADLVNVDNSNLIGNSGMTFNAIREAINAQMSGTAQPWTNDQKFQMGMLLRAHRANVERRALDLANTRLDDTGRDPSTYLSLMHGDTSKVNEIIKTNLAVIDRMISSVGGGDLTMIGVDVARTEAGMKSEWAHLLNTSKALRKIEQYKNLPNEFKNLLFVDQSDTIKAAGKAVNDFYTMAQGDKDPSANTDRVVSEMDRAYNGSKHDPAFWQSYVNKRQEILSNPVTDPREIEKVAGIAQGTYTGAMRLLGRMNDERQRETLYQKWTSNLITDNLQRLKQTDPDMWNAYTKWANDAFGAVYTRSIGTLRNLTSNPNVELRANEETGQLEGRVNPEFLKKQTKQKTGKETTVETPWRSDFELGDMQRFNRGLSILAPVWKAQGKTMEEGLLELGIDLKLKLNP